MTSSLARVIAALLAGLVGWALLHLTIRRSNPFIELRASSLTLGKVLEEPKGTTSTMAPSLTPALAGVAEKLVITTDDPKNPVLDPQGPFSDVVFKPAGPGSACSSLAVVPDKVEGIVSFSGSDDVNFCLSTLDWRKAGKEYDSKRFSRAALFYPASAHDNPILRNVKMEKATAVLLEPPMVFGSKITSCRNQVELEGHMTLELLSVSGATTHSLFAKIRAEGSVHLRDKIDAACDMRSQEPKLVERIAPELAGLAAMVISVVMMAIFHRRRKGTSP